MIDQIAQLGGTFTSPTPTHHSTDWQSIEAALSVPTFNLVPKYTESGRFAGPLTQFKGQSQAR
eukprot:scaffold60542_cov57-Cyclotella_meneghiniana.AAC.1